MSVLGAAVGLSYAMLAVAAVLAFLRLWRGPGLADRAIALDLVAMLLVGFIATHIVDTGLAVFLDAAVVLTLVAFLGTVAFAHHIVRRSQP